MLNLTEVVESSHWLVIIAIVVCWSFIGIFAAYKRRSIAMSEWAKNDGKQPALFNVDVLYSNSSEG